MHGLAGVHLHRVANPERERHGVLRLIGNSRAGRRRDRPSDQRLLEAIGEAGLSDDVGHVVAEVRGQRLPFDREETVPLQVAERAVVGDEFEAVVGALEGAARAVTAVLRSPT